MAWTPELLDWVRTRAVEAGFDLAGVAPAHAASDLAAQPTAERFTAWVDAGRAGEMDYLKRRDDAGQLLRTSVQVAIPWARSVVVCAMNYNADAPRSIDPAPPDTGWIARYAWSGDPDGIPVDYHDDMLARLRAVEAALREQTTCETRCYVDTGPILERDLAAKAGIGWVGKNTCVIHQQLGSWLLLGVIATSLPLPEAELTLAADRCGTCTRCIDACPTGALVAPRQMDASLCIAYLTIEKKGAIAEPLREKIGRQVFGCDICQDVCPWNRRAPIARKPEFQPRPELINPDLEWIAALDAPAFKRWFKGSPLERTKRHRLQRNVAIAMGNTRDPKCTARLEQWAAGEDPVLAEAAQWALGQLAHV